jgi:hypothetical protein
MNQDIVYDFFVKNPREEFTIIDVTRAVFEKEDIDRYGLEFSSVCGILGRLRNQKRVKRDFRYPYTYYSLNKLYK